MLIWKVTADYDFDRHVWYVAKSNVPGLVIEAATIEDFRAEANRRGREAAEGGDSQITVKTGAYWSFSAPFMNRVLVNGRLVSREQARELEEKLNLPS